MKAILHEYGMALFSMICVIFLICIGSPVSKQVQAAMVDVVNEATDVATFDDLKIVDDGVPDTIYAGYNPSNTTLYFANNEEDIKKAGVDVTGSNYYGDISQSCDYQSIKERKYHNIAGQITRVNILSEIKPTSCCRWFNVCTNLKQIYNIKNLNTENCKNLSQVFRNCGALTSLDVSHFNTRKAETMDSMFNGCSSLTSLDVSNFNTTNVTNMMGMFYECNSLTSLDVSNFNTTNVTNMMGMFTECNSLTSLDVSNFDTSKVTDMGWMFDHCYALENLDLHNFNTSNVIRTRTMFSQCKALKTLDISNFDMSKVTDINYMFEQCTNLTSLKIGKFERTSVQSNDYIFKTMPDSAKIYTSSQSTKDWILGLSDSSRPSVWTSDNIIVQ